MGTNYQSGHEAEIQAAQYLRQNGFKIRQLNWKTRYCEIDIVAEKKKRVYFVEVKFRSNDRQGYGLDYVTAKKLKQMKFAAEMWVSDNEWGYEYQLAVISIDNGRITFIDQVE